MATGCMALRREEDAVPAKLPEDLTAGVKKAVAAESDAELERFYQAAQYTPVWKDRRDEVVAALKTAEGRGLRQEDYLLGQTEVALTKGLMRFAGDLRYGKANPGIYDQAERNPLGELAWTIAQDPAGVQAALRKLDPPFAEFPRLEAALSRAEPADRPRLEQALEQWRWLPRSLPHGAILVNIPEFRLQAVDENVRVALEMPVIVGKVGNQTPLFTANLKYLVFGPYWNVPKSILANELVPDITKNRTYLSRNSYEVVNGAGQVVSTGEVSDQVLAGLKAGELSVRQVPGAKNSLGRVKFMFPNQDNVYLHDTPSRNLFSKEQRALSHGCVRVSNPQGLDEWVLRGQPEWTKERIEEGLKRTKPLQANMKDAVPVFMLYHAVTVDEDGQVHVWKDLYKREATTAEPGPRPRE